MNTDLHTIAQQMVANNKGLLAADETVGTIQKRLDAVGVENTEENRRAYREMLFTAPNIGDYISGVILHEETVRQSTAGGVSFLELLKAEGVLPGVKVDGGKEPFAEGSAEVLTKGLDGLAERLAEYARLGAMFTKWRAVITIGEEIPTDECIRENMVRLAQYAKLVQEAGMVPMVEPEVLMDGAHSLQTCKEVTLRAQYALFEELERIGVDLKGIILKPNFVVPGKESGETFDPVVSARETLDVLGETTPLEVPAVMFLSGGLSESQATDVLREINRLREEHMWKLSFSYGRALQSSALKAWGGKSENVSAAQSAFLEQARANSVACLK